MADFQLVAPFKPTGDQPQAIEQLVAGLAAGRKHQVLLGATGTGKTLHDRQGHRAGEQAHPRAGAQQDAGRPALQRVPRLLPGQRRGVLRQLLRLLPARGLPAAQRHLHREGLLPQRGDRQAAARRHAGALRAARRHHRGQRLLHLRPGRARGLRRHGPAAARGWPLPAGRRAAPAGGPAVRAQRPGPQPGQVPRPRGHPGAAAGLRRLHRPGRVLRGRGGARHGGRSAHRRDPRRARGAQRLPRLPLRHAAGEAGGGHRGHRGRGGAARRGARAEGHDPGGGAAPPAHHLRPGDDARAGLLLRASRTTRGTSPAASPARAPGRCSTTSRRTGCWSWTRAT